jgi:hypothetical protein
MCIARWVGIIKFSFFLRSTIFSWRCRGSSVVPNLAIVSGDTQAVFALFARTSGATIGQIGPAASRPPCLVSYNGTPSTIATWNVARVMLLWHHGAYTLGTILRRPITYDRIMSDELTRASKIRIPSLITAEAGMRGARVGLSGGRAVLVYELGILVWC